MEEHGEKSQKDEGKKDGLMTEREIKGDKWKNEWRNTRRE